MHISLLQQEQEAREKEQINWQPALEQQWLDQNRSFQSMQTFMMAMYGDKMKKKKKELKKKQKDVIDIHQDDSSTSSSSLSLDSE